MGSSIDRICSPDTRSDALAVSEDVDTQISQYHRSHKQDPYQYRHEQQNTETVRNINDTHQKYNETYCIQLEEELNASKTKIKEYEIQIAQKNDEINVLQNDLNGYNDQKLDVKLKDVPFSNTQKQFEVLYDEGSRARSLYLCCKSEWINGRNMSFCKWLKNNVNNERAIPFNPSETVNADMFISLLVKTVMIYKIQLHQQRTNSKERPRIDASKLKRFVQHLCVWIIRNKGIQTNEKVLIEVKREYGAVIKEEVFKCKISLNKQEFGRNISEWVGQYVEDQGILDDVI